MSLIRSFCLSPPYNPWDVGSVDLVATVFLVAGLLAVLQFLEQKLRFDMDERPIALQVDIKHS